MSSLTFGCFRSCEKATMSSPLKTDGEGTWAHQVSAIPGAQVHLQLSGAQVPPAAAASRPGALRPSRSPSPKYNLLYKLHFGQLYGHIKAVLVSALSALRVTQGIEGEGIYSVVEGTSKSLQTNCRSVKSFDPVKERGNSRRHLTPLAGPTYRLESKLYSVGKETYSV
jgi:hypothetical protein